MKLNLLVSQNFSADLLLPCFNRCCSANLNRLSSFGAVMQPWAIFCITIIPLYLCSRKKIRLQQLAPSFCASCNMLTTSFHRHFFSGKIFMQQSASFVVKFQPALYMQLYGMGYPLSSLEHMSKCASC